MRTRAECLGMRSIRKLIVDSVREKADENGELPLSEVDQVVDDVVTALHGIVRRARRLDNLSRIRARFVRLRNSMRSDVRSSDNNCGLEQALHAGFRLRRRHQHVRTSRPVFGRGQRSGTVRSAAAFAEVAFGVRNTGKAVPALPVTSYQCDVQLLRGLHMRRWVLRHLNCTSQLAARSTQAQGRQRIRWSSQDFVDIAGID
jgi:hypothetical protein